VHLAQSVEAVEQHLSLKVAPFDKLQVVMRLLVPNQARPLPGFVAW
jgi:hypothetical protein